jgi:hypothetical protein
MQELALYILGAFAVMGIAGVLVASARDLRAGSVVVCLVVFCAAVSTQAMERGDSGRTWLYPLQKLRAESYLALSCVLGLVVLIHASKVVMTRVSTTAVLMLVINIFAGVMDTRENVRDGALRVGLATVSIGSMALFATAMFRTWDSYLPLMRALGVVGLLWVSGAMVQAVLDKSQMLVNYQTRFVGLLGNPQGTAVYLGPQSAIMLWLLLNDPSRRMRKLWVLLYAILVMMVIWTGSRTGAILAIVGAMFMLRAKLGRSVILVPLFGSAFFGIALIVQGMGINLPFSRFLEGGDTRTVAWKTLLDDALHAGMFGEGVAGARYVENSFLLGWVTYGPLMLMILLAVVLSLFVMGVKLWKIRHEVPEHIASIIDLFLAYSVMFVVAGQFEWFIISRVDANIPFVVLFSCMGSCILIKAREQRVLRAEAGSYDTPEALDYGEDPEPPVPDQAF